MLVNIWAGSGDSFLRFREMDAKYFQENRMSAGDYITPHAEKLASVLQVDEERPGLNLIKTHGYGNATLSISGSLVNRHAWWHPYMVGEITSYEALKDAVNILLEQKDIQNVLLLVDSGGGQVTGLSAASKSISALGKKKEMKVHVDSVAASAGYWLASAAQKEITASEMAQVGSIGVFAAYMDYSEALEKEGVKYHVISAGKEKAYGFPGSKFTEEEIAALQKSVDKTNNFFLTHVSKTRGLSMSKTDDWAEAQIFYAGEAKVVGLVDKVADLDGVLGSFAAVKPKEGMKAMNISEEKLAKILSGAAPETVLTPEELAEYMAEVTKPVEPESVQEPVASVTEPEDTMTTDSAKQIGRLEAKLEFEVEKSAAYAEKIASLTADIGSLLEVAQVAVTNLQVALQQPKDTKSTVSGVLAQFNSLQELRAERFKPGRTSSSASSTEEIKLAPHPLRPN